jgi:hypothetical protein
MGSVGYGLTRLLVPTKQFAVKWLISQAESGLETIVDDGILSN